MTDTIQLLQRITALRKRLDAGPVTAAPSIVPDPLQLLEDKVHRGAQHNQIIENAIRGAELTDPTAPAPPPVRLTARGARLLRKGRDLLKALRTISDEPVFPQIEEHDALSQLHREGVAMIEVLLRTVQTFPASVSAQLRMCDGLEVVLQDAEDRITLLCGSLVHRKREIARINELADFLLALTMEQEVRLAPLQALADAILAEAKAGLPLKFLYASPQEPARFAAAQGLTVAHIMARLIHNDPEWEHQVQLAIMAALIHDVGMVRVPAEVLLTPGPLNSDQQRLVEKHALAAESLLTGLWPGGGWPLEAAVHHHERADGTGYPAGKKLLEQSAFGRLLAVCDVYAAMCSRRPHRPAHDTRAAMTEVLFLAERDFLDRKEAERLLMLSFYPIGAAVELNDGAIAIVTATHSHQRGLTNPGRPIVHLVGDAQGQSIPWPTVIDLLEHTDRSIVRGLNADERQLWLGKKYPQLV
jgi:hypothetical protein